MILKIINKLALGLLILGFTNISYGIEQCVITSNFGKTEQQALWVTKVSFSEAEKHKRYISYLQSNKLITYEESFPISGHFLTGGTGDAIIYRDYFLGYPQLSDSSGVVLITVFSSKQFSGDGVLNIGKDSDAFVFVTVGSPNMHDYCTGYATKGTINYYSSFENNKKTDYILGLLGVKNGVYAEILLNVNLVDPENLWPEKCSSCIFDANIIFRKSDIEPVNNIFKKRNK